MPLFDRIGRRLELTPFGRETLVRANQLLAAQVRHFPARLPAASASSALRIKQLAL
jgi:DNA-binding transcriptional LysR family regulator